MEKERIEKEIGKAFHDDGGFLQDRANPKALEAYADLLACRESYSLISTLWGTADVWFMYEQVFPKLAPQAASTAF